MRPEEDASVDGAMGDGASTRRCFGMDGGLTDGASATVLSGRCFDRLRLAKYYSCFSEIQEGRKFCLMEGH